jgi:anti-sigma-K factor RskA
MWHDHLQPSTNGQPKPSLWLSWRLWRWIGLAIGAVSAGVTVYRFWKRD